MIGRVVEIAEDGRHLSVHRGFLVVKGEGTELGRVALDDIGMVIANAHGITYSNNLLVALAERGAGLVLCGGNHLPVAWLWPVAGHHVQAARMGAQIEAPRPLRKRLWQILVRAKIGQQLAVLDVLGKPTGGFDLLARRVRSGDPENVEAQASRRYWPRLMGEEFRRDRSLGGVNALLNYGYTILRSATARAVVGAGLHPSIGLHHHNQYDSMRLADDLMEPFRPLVDLACVRLVVAGREEVTAESKRVLAGVLLHDMHTERGTTPLETCLSRLAVSLVRAFEDRCVKLELPLSLRPLDLSDLGRAGQDGTG